MMLFVAVEKLLMVRQQASVEGQRELTSKKQPTEDSEKDAAVAKGSSEIADEQKETAASPVSKNKRKREEEAEGRQETKKPRLPQPLGQPGKRPPPKAMPGRSHRRQQQLTV